MWRLTLAGVAAHRTRYALTALAVLIGVAFMAGSYILTDTIRRTFDGLFTSIYHNTTAVVRAREPFTPSVTWSGQRPRIPAGLEAVVRRVPGVRAVRVDIEGYAQLVAPDGKVVGNPAAGPPTLGEAWPGRSPMSEFRLLPGGRPPATPTEVVVDKHSADVGHLAVGSRVEVLTKLAPATYTVTGVAMWGSVDSPLGASMVLFTPATAARVLGAPGQVDQIDVYAPGVSQAAMARRLTSALANPRLEVVTGAQVTREGQSGVAKALGPFDTLLLAFAVVALFVGAFLIVNTFSIMVGQRQRELALLRALGASRRQVLGSVLGESAVLGLVASAVGLAAGAGLALALRAGLSALGYGIPASGLLVSARTVVVSLAVGTAVTVLAAVGPARRAARIPPVAALREVEVAGGPPLARSVAVGSGLLLAGSAALGLGLAGAVGARLALVGAGAAAVFLGVAALGPVLAGPVIGLLGARLARAGAPGLLARGNALRNPRRTAATSAALMVSVALVALMSVVAASLTASVDTVVDNGMRADLVVSSGAGGTGQTGFAPALRDRLARLPQVAVAAGVQGSPARVRGQQVTVLAIDPRQADALFSVGVVAGRLDALSATGIAVSQHVARADHLAVGDRLPVQFTRTGTRRLTVQVVYTARALAGDYVLPLSGAAAAFTRQLDFQVYLKLAPGVGLAPGRQAVERALAGYPTATLLDRAQYKAQVAGQVDQLLNLVTALLGFAVLIALLSIANALSLAVYERTRELGLLRAVGMTRRQLRRSVRLESLLVALFGVLEGLVVGTLLGWAVVSSLGSQGVTALSVPVPSLAELAVVAVLAGVVAAGRPARRAARLDVLTAVASE